MQKMPSVSITIPGKLNHMDEARACLLFLKFQT